jgi:hypothetical protein
MKHRLNDLAKSAVARFIVTIVTQPFRSHGLGADMLVYRYSFDTIFTRDTSYA